MACSDVGAAGARDWSAKEATGTSGVSRAAVAKADTSWLLPGALPEGRAALEYGSGATSSLLEYWALQTCTISTLSPSTINN